MKRKIVFVLSAICFMVLAPLFASAAVDCTSACQALGHSGTALQNCISGCEANNTNNTPNADPAPTSGASSVVFANPIGFTSVSDVLDSLLNNLMGIIVIIAVIFIVIGGIMYLVSGGDSKMVERAKATWTGAVIGLAIALAAPTFLKEIQSILGGGGTGGSAASWVANALTIQQIAANLLNLLLSLVGIIAMIALVIGGARYLTSYGDQKKIDSGKEIIRYAIIGLVVSLAALVIVRQVSALLGA